MPGLLLVELEGTIIYKTWKNRLSMVCEKCLHFIHMNSKNWHFVTWYLCEKLLMCQYMLFLSWKSVLLISKSFMNAVLFKWPKFLLRSYLTKTCAISAYFMIRARFGGGWGFGAIYMSLKRISDVLLQLLEMFDSWDQFRFLLVRINLNHSFEFIYHFSHWEVT